MKKNFLVLALICILFSLTCGCTHEIPEFLPGEKEEDAQFVWVCKEPFSIFALTDDHKEQYYGHMKGYIENESEFSYFYSVFNRIDGTTNFIQEELWDDPSEYESFWGYVDYRKNYFDLEITRDNINFFGGTLPKMRFEKMTKEEFAKKYPSIDLEEPGRTG